MKIIDLGLITYRDALGIQEQCLKNVREGGEETIFILEHYPVVTLGKNAGKEHLHTSEAMLAKQGVDLFKTTRGGDITCHFPGQLIVYPIVRVNKIDGGMHGIFNRLEEYAIRLAAHYGVQTERRDGFPGVWIGKRKICSIGLAAKHWITYHGLAFNVLPDLSLFNSITLCGLNDAVPTSLCSELNSNSVTIDNVKKISTGILEELF